ncbi:MAG TPA: phosphoribosylanthranilate isomerase [Flavisolibacter sp.]|nr:phosphoribosylanthranilate isomerase [Flavisolibacter sp.]
MKIKVCGITSIEQLQSLQDLGIDYAGMIFYPPSKRYAGVKLVDQQPLIKNTVIPKVGVFVNAEMEMVKQTIVDYGLTAVQLHGDETDEFCLDLMDQVEVIKVFRIADQVNIDELVTPFQEVCHYYMFDTDTKMYGGSGKQFNWNVLQQAAINKPFFLSGGIGLEDVDKVKAFQHPYFYAIDINSRFETEPGVKDINRVALFVKELNA